VHKNTSLLNCKLRCIGLGRVGSKILGWVELGQSADGLGWIGSHKMDPWTTLVHPIDARTLYVHDHSLTTGRQTDTHGQNITQQSSRHLAVAVAETRGQSNFIKAASPARTDQSGVFARWRQCARSSTHRHCTSTTITP